MNLERLSAVPGPLPAKNRLRPSGSRRLSTVLEILTGRSSQHLLEQGRKSTRTAMPQIHRDRGDTVAIAEPCNRGEQARLLAPFRETDAGLSPEKARATRGAA